jgi:hypothetical protein
MRYALFLTGVAIAVAESGANANPKKELIDKIMHYGQKWMEVEASAWNQPSVQPKKLHLSEEIYPPANSHRVNRPPKPFQLEPLRWGQVQANGWIRDWAEAAARGAGSPKHAMFANIKAFDYPPFHIPPECQLSVDGWKNGRPCSLAFFDEDSAYWIDGMTRLGAVLHDAVLIARVKEDYEAVMANPDYFNATWTKGKSDGGNEAEGWVRSVYSRGLLAYYDYTGDQRILSFLGNALGNYSSADSEGERSLTQIEPMVEAFAYGAPHKLVGTAIEMMEQRSSSLRYLNTLLSGCTNDTAKITKGDCLNKEHGVTFNELAKLFAMIYSWNSNASFLQASVNAFDMVEEYNMQVHGAVSANEQLAGIGPNVGTETCDVADFTYSNQWMLRVVGRAKYGDHVERAFFNAAPGAVNRSFNGHVYYQSPNLCNTSKGVTGPANDPALTDPRWEESWFHTPPCCTGNQVRMLPNFIHHMWFGTPEGGLAATLHGPSMLNTTVQGVRTSIVSSTDYPFDDTITFTIRTDAEAEKPTWSLKLRIPGWCTDPKITVDGTPVAAITDENGFATVRRAWGAASIVVLQLPAVIRATQRTTFANGNQDIGPYNPKYPWAKFPGQNGTGGMPFCVVEYGALTFALPLEAGTPGIFNYAMLCDAEKMYVVHKNAVVRPFDWPLQAPLQIVALAARFHWPDVWTLPPTAVPAEGLSLEQVVLIPYGNAKQFHVSMFPVLSGPQAPPLAARGP